VESWFWFEEACACWFEDKVVSDIVIEGKNWADKFV
jgi:hypothetical protein